MTSHRTAVVGGGSAGIGYASAVALLNRGFQVMITGRDEENLVLAAAKLNAEVSSGHRGDTLADEVCFHVADMAAPDSAAVIVARATEQWGRLDVVVANAGGPPPARILELSEDDWASAAQLLLFGPLRLARLALPVMAENDFGRLIFVTSAQVRQPDPDLASSVVLRTALTSAAKLASREVAADGITVNCVAPGATDTGRRRRVLERRAAASGEAYSTLAAADAAAVPAGRPARPDEIGAAIAFLASDEASYINGTVLTVDGGRTETV